MTIHELTESGAELLHDHGVDNYRNEVRYILMEIIDKDVTYIMLHGDEEVKKEHEELFDYRIRQRCKRYPLQYILGHQEFYGLDFMVDQSVLIPRQDTEILVEHAIACLKEHFNDRTPKVLDLCTGSGCIGITLAKNVNIELTISDRSREALAVATKNLKKHEVSADIICGDLFEEMVDTFDVITANPPYIPRQVINTLMPEVREFEPMMALDGHEDGLYFYRRIAKEAGRYMEEDGHIFLEIGYDQGPGVKRIFEDQGFRDVEVIKDYAKDDRVVHAVRYKEGTK